jgi:hypothetical protein
LRASFLVVDSIRTMSSSKNEPLKPQSTIMDRQYTALAHDGPRVPPLRKHDSSNASAHSWR